LDSQKFTDADIAKLRDDTPGCKHRNHLNNAGASLMPKPVIDSIVNHINLESEIGGYEAAEAITAEIEDFYEKAAALLGCLPGNIAYTANATDSYSRAISSVPFQPGDVILTTNEDYVSNQLTLLSLQKRFGIKLLRSETTKDGILDLDDFRTKLNKFNPKLVSITHVPTNSGIIQPIEEIGKLTKDKDTLLLIDACQSIGQIPMEVNELRCDFLTATSRKFLRGPRGAGFLYVSDKALELGLEPLYIDMRGADWVSTDKYESQPDAKRFEDFESAFALLLGTKASIEYALNVSVKRIRARNLKLTNHLRKQLSLVPEVRLLDKGDSLAAIVVIAIEGADIIRLSSELLEKRINVIPSLRQFALIDYDSKKVESALRISPHYYNTIEELDEFIDALGQLLI
jgi:selenocysteine lyase/cysteine desulfurase